MNGFENPTGSVFFAIMTIENLYLAIDLGGTFIKYGILREHGEILSKAKVKTPTNVTINELYERVDQLINPLLKKNPSIKGIAISAPGAVTPEGYIHGVSAIPCIHGPNIKEDLETRYGLPVAIENDANCAALAEINAGSAKGLKDVLFVVCGTGVGGAVIKNGKLHKGQHLLAGEFGMLVQYSQAEQKAQSFSWLASTGNMVARASKGLGRPLSGEEVFALAETGNSICQEEVAAFYNHLAVLLTNLQCVYDPELIVISGGVTERKVFARELDNAIDKINRLRGSLSIETAVEVAAFKNDANLIGAVFNLIN